MVQNLILCGIVLTNSKVQTKACLVFDALDEQGSGVISQAKGRIFIRQAVHLSNEIMPFFLV